MPIAFPAVVKVDERKLPLVLIAWPDRKRGQLVAIAGQLILGYVLTQPPLYYRTKDGQ